MGKILVTGSGGLIGEKICTGLLKRGNTVVATDTRESGCNIATDGYRFVKATYSDKDIFEKLFKQEKFDTVLHCAFTVDNDLGNIITDEEIEHSSQFDEFIYSLALESEVKQFILISTSMVYELPKSREPIRETDRLKPVSNYAKLKLESEKKFDTVIQGHQEMVSAILRLAPIYTSDFGDNLLNKILDPETNSLFVYYSGDYGFQFCCLHNLIEFIFCFIGAAEDYKYTGIYNIGDDNIITAREIIKYARDRNSYGPVIQKNVNVGTLKGKLGKLTNRNESKINYRYNDIDTFFNNNVLDGTRAKKVCSFKWNIANTK